MASAKKHAQRSHKTYRNGKYAFSYFKPALSHKKWMAANDLRSSSLENFIARLISFGRALTPTSKKRSKKGV